MPGLRRWPPGSRPGRGSGRSWLAELDRQGLLEELLAEDVIARALREAPPGHKYDRVLTAKMTVICVLVACLFPGAGYDTVLATAFGLPGPAAAARARKCRPAAAFSQARRLLGEQVMKKIFELDAAVADADLGIGLLWKGLEVTAIDGTTMELARNGVLEDGFGTPAERRPPAAAGHRPRPHRDLPVDRRCDRRLPRRRERPGRSAGGQLPARHPQPRRPRLLLHAPLDPVLRHRRGPGLAGQERREIRPAQDPRRLSPMALSWSCCTNQTACAPGAGRKQATCAPNGSRTPSPGWSPSPSPPRPAAAGRRPP